MSIAQRARFLFSVLISSDFTTNLIPEYFTGLGWPREPHRSVPDGEPLYDAASRFPGDCLAGSGK